MLGRRTYPRTFDRDGPNPPSLSKRASGCVPEGPKEGYDRITRAGSGCCENSTRRKTGRILLWLYLRHLNRLLKAGKKGEPTMRLLIPLETESYEAKRKRELFADLKLWDAALDSLVGELRDERTASGLTFYQEMPTSLKSPRMLALQAGLNQLARWHSDALKEYANLV